MTTCEESPFAMEVAEAAARTDAAQLCDLLADEYGRSVASVQHGRLFDGYYVVARTGRTEADVVVAVTAAPCDVRVSPDDTVALVAAKGGFRVHLFTMAAWDADGSPFVSRSARDLGHAVRVVADYLPPARSPRPGGHA